MRESRINAKQQLAVKVEDGVLTISIGIAVLAYAVQTPPDWPEEFYIYDVDDFAKEMARELRREEEDGTTLVHRAFDAAANNVLENGGDGVDEGNVETGLSLLKPMLDGPSA